MSVFMVTQFFAGRAKETESKTGRREKKRGREKKQKQMTQCGQRHSPQIFAGI